MYETARRYSDVTYCTKETIANEIDNYLLEPIWQEIRTYRSFFRIDLKVFEKPYYLTRNALVVNETLQVEELLLQYHAEPLCTEDVYCSYLSDEGNQQYRQYVTHLSLNKTMPGEEFFTSFFLQFAIEDVTRSQLDFLLNKEESFLLRLYTLCLLESRRSRHLLYYPFLLLHKKTQLHRIFDFLAFADERTAQDPHDITYDYLEMLKQLRLILYRNMVLLKTDDKALQRTMLETELMERFPLFKKEQIQFYVHHRSIGHYYTIQNYIKHCGVCYETARYSLDQLVTYHWYDKKKIGKKFVYFVV